MEELFTVKISDERFPALSECTKETNISLVIVQCGSDSVELTIESQEPDNDIEPEYQEPTYIVWITDQGETIDKLVHPFDFENMEVREIIHTMIDVYMDEIKEVVLVHKEKNDITSEEDVVDFGGDYDGESDDMEWLMSFDIVR